MTPHLFEFIAGPPAPSRSRSTAVGRDFGRTPIAARLMVALLRRVANRNRLQMIVFESMEEDASQTFALPAGARFGPWWEAVLRRRVQILVLRDRRGMFSRKSKAS